MFVKKNTCGEEYEIYKKYGVPTVLDVRVACAIEVSTSTVAISNSIPFSACPFAQLPQLPLESWADVVGRVAETDARRVSDALPKLTLKLREGPLYEEVVLLGQKAQLAINVGDIVALRSVQRKEYYDVQLLITSYLTHVLVNPASEAHIPIQALKDMDMQSPMKKCTKGVPSLTLSSLGIEDSLRRLKSSALAGKKEKVVCIFIGRVWSLSRIQEYQNPTFCVMNKSCCHWHTVGDSAFRHTHTLDYSSFTVSI